MRPFTWTHFLPLQHQRDSFSQSRTTLRPSQCLPSCLTTAPLPPLLLSRTTGSRHTDTQTPYLLNKGRYRSANCKRKLTIGRHWNRGWPVKAEILPSTPRSNNNGNKTSMKYWKKSSSAPLISFMSFKNQNMIRTGTTSTWETTKPPRTTWRPMTPRRTRTKLNMTSTISYTPAPIRRPINQREKT